MKVGREEIAGLITALRTYAAGDDEADRETWMAVLDIVAEELGEPDGVRVLRRLNVAKPVPLLSIAVNPEQVGLNGYEVVAALLAGQPLIAVAESYADTDVVIVNPQGLAEEEATVVGRRLREVLMGSET
jgi:L-seryl-tRNA(Ser) seleniumtransferase